MHASCMNAVCKHICMNKCMYVCMHVSKYVCKYVCMYVRMGETCLQVDINSDQDTCIYNCMHNHTVSVPKLGSCMFRLLCVYVIHSIAQSFTSGKVEASR